MIKFCFYWYVLNNALCVAGQGYRFGKYFWWNKGMQEYSDNTYWLYRAPATILGAKSPVIVQFFGSAWVAQQFNTGAFTTTQPFINDYNANGISFVSTGYRLINREYHFVANDGSGTISREELIHVSKDGSLSLDQTGRTIADYKPTACYLELITKCMFDVVQTLEHLILNADEFGLDIHRIVFLGSSAGTAPAGYLTWIYHQWNVGRFTPVGMVLTDPQFNLPVVCSVGQIWQDFLEHTEDGFLVSDIAPFETCGQVLGCPLKPFGSFNSSQLASVCNPQWNAQTRSQYCSSRAVYDATPVANLNVTQAWDPSLSEFGEGLETLWYTSRSMLRHQPRPFHIFVSVTEDRSHTVMGPWFIENSGMLHHPMYVQEYAELADQVGIDYTVFFGQYKGMRPNPLTKLLRAQESEVIVDYGWSPVYYASSVGWRGKFPALKAIDPHGQMPAHLPFTCYVTGMSCSPNNSNTALPWQLLGLLVLLIMALCCCVAGAWACATMHSGKKKKRKLSMSKRTPPVPAPTAGPAQELVTIPETDNQPLLPDLPPLLPLTLPSLLPLTVTSTGSQSYQMLAFPRLANSFSQPPGRQWRRVS